MEVGGTPETTSQAFTATTTWQQVFIYKEFTGAGTGNAQMEITLTATGTLQVSGMQLERRLGGQFCNMAAPTTFIKTTTDTVEILPDFLWYKAYGNTNPKSGTFIVWAWLDCDSEDLINSDGPTLFGIDGGQGNYICQFHFVADNLIFSYGSPTPAERVAIIGPVGILKHQWHQYAVTWTANDIGNFSLTLWVDGVEEATSTFSNGALTSWGRILIGGCNSSQLAKTYGKVESVKLSLMVKQALHILQTIGLRTGQDMGGNE